MSSTFSQNLRGSALMVAAMACYTFNDTLIKVMGGDMPLSQLLLIRGLMTAVFIGAIAWHSGAIKWRLPKQDWFLILLRSISELFAAYFFVYALRRMEIANVTAVLQILPLTVASGAALFFKEPLGWRRMLAILVGFLGMLLIVRPGTDTFGTETISALGSVLFITIRDLCAKKMSDQVPSQFVAWITAIVVSIGAALAMTVIEWQPVTATEFGLMAGMAVFIGGGYLFATMTMRVGDISFVAPFRYTGLLWAMLMGFLMFGDWPDALTLIGGAIVVGAGMFTLLREAKLARA